MHLQRVCSLSSKAPRPFGLGVGVRCTFASCGCSCWLYTWAGGWSGPRIRAPTVDRRCPSMERGALVVVLPAHLRFSLLPGCRTLTLPALTVPPLHIRRSSSPAIHLCFNSIAPTEKQVRSLLSCLPRSLVRWLPRSPAAPGGRCDANVVHPIGRQRLHRLRLSEFKLEKKRETVISVHKIHFY